jgi:hypothetical protein
MSHSITNARPCDIFTSANGTIVYEKSMSHNVAECPTSQNARASERHSSRIWIVPGREIDTNAEKGRIRPCAMGIH